MHSIPASAPLDWIRRQDMGQYGGSLGCKYFLDRNLAIGLTAEYLQTDLDSYYRLAGSECIRAQLGLSAVYVGLGATWYQPLGPRFSLLAGADLGALFPAGLRYELSTLSDGYAPATLQALGIAPFSYSGQESLGSESQVAGHLKVGAQYLFTHVTGLVAYGGYQVAKLMVRYPDQDPFNRKDADGAPIFSPAKIDLSGFFFRAGLAIYFGDSPAASEPGAGGAPPEDNKGTVRLLPSPKPSRDELGKFLDLKKVKSFFRPSPVSPLHLYVASGPGQPASAPALTALPAYENLAASQLTPSQDLKREVKGVKRVARQNPAAPVYALSRTGYFVDTQADARRWFAFNLPADSGVTQVLWQVSRSQFMTAGADWKAPAALVASGTVPATQQAFDIDFNAIGRGKFHLATAPGPGRKPRQRYYVRALPLDANGDLVGDPVPGLEVVCGDRLINPPAQAPAYELWTPLFEIGKYSGENMDLPKHQPELTIHPAGATVVKLFDFHGLKDLQARIVIQVSERPFDARIGVMDPAKLLYTQQYDLPAPRDYGPGKDDYPAVVIIPFHEFAKNMAQLQQGEYYKYYVRGLVLKPGRAPGTWDTELTDVVTVNYGLAAPVTWYGPPVPKTQTVPYALPEIRIKSYVPAQEQARDCFSHYYIFRAPAAHEITCRWRNTNGYVLYPYIGPYVNWYASRGIHNAQQYEQIEIPKVLQPGWTVHIPPPVPEDKPWYEELWDGVVGFFEDLWKAAQALANTVAGAYNDLKAGLINTVASLCPEKYRGAFKTIVEGFVNYGLVAIGLPPSLPNFDELSQMSMDYLAEVALTEAGVPANELTEELAQDIAQEFARQVEAAAKRPAPNPVNAPFLKLDPAYLSRPAYVVVEMKNPTNQPTVPGRFDMTVTFEFDSTNMFFNNVDPDDGISFSIPTNYAAGSAAAITVSMQYQNHFFYGLNGDSLDYFYRGDKAVYDVFDPVLDQPVPILRPQETREVRLYLSLFMGSSYARYPGGEMVRDNDSLIMYYLNGNKKFTNFYLSGHFPIAGEFMRTTGYLHTQSDVELVYQNSGSVSDTKTKKPVSRPW